MPLYYGSSFAYLSAISGLVAAQGFEKINGILPTEAIQIAQFGIIMSGFVSIAAGLLVRFAGRNIVEKILPPCITGPVAMIIGLTGAVVMFMAGLSWRIIGVLAAAAIAIVPPFVMFGMHDYQRNRILTFLNPEADPSGTGYNIIQSKIALGSGGLMGKGYGLGSQSQLEFLPERHTDFIFSTVSEEFGFLGSFTVLACYVALILISLRIAALSHSHFGRISAAGMTAFLALFVLINGAMVMGLAPVVGVPMPLLSYGGSTMMTVMIGFGLILSTRVHRYVELPKGQGLF